MSYESEVLADAPFIYWRLGDSSGTTAVDDSGNGIDGTYYNSPTLGVAGLIAFDSDTAVNFPNSGSTDIKVDSGTWPTTDVACPSGFSLECWVNFPTLGGGFGEIVAIYGPGGATSSTSNDVEITLDYDGVNHYLGYWFQCSSWDDAQVHNYVAFSGVTTGTIYHIVLTFDGVDTVKFYVNGSLVESQTLVSPALPFTIFSDSNGNPLTVADDGFNQGDGIADATIDEVALYNYALDAGRVTVHYGAGNGGAVTFQDLEATHTQDLFIDASGRYVFGKEVDGTQVQFPTLQTVKALPRELTADQTQTADLTKTIAGRYYPSRDGLIEHSGSTTFSDAMSAGPPTGGEYLGDDDGGGRLVGADFAFGQYSSYESFFAFDTSDYVTTPDTVSLGIAILADDTFFDGSLTFYVAPYNFGATLDSADWRTTTNLGGLTACGSFTASSVTTGYLTIDLNPSCIVLGGTTRLVMYSSQEVAPTAPTGANDHILFDGRAGTDPPYLAIYPIAGTVASQTITATATQTLILTAGANVTTPTVGVFVMLGVPDAKTQDVDYAFRDGSNANPDDTQVRVLTFNVIIRATTATDAMNALRTLETAFATSPVDVPATIQMPGWLVSMNGRPRGVKADLVHVQFGAIHALCRFDCLDPTLTYT
jgi:hypothetical protein